MNYNEFLHTKIEVAPASGFDVRPEDIHPALKPHQRDAVRWAIRGGRRALFESFGLGKTVQELEWCRLVQEHEQAPVIIVLPLGVRQEFTRDAVELLGMEPPVYVRTMEEVKANPAKIYMTNYERVRDGDIDPRYFAGAALDEAFAACPTAHICGSREDSTFTEGSDCDKFNQTVASSCRPVITNGDWIRSMTNKDLAEFLGHVNICSHIQWSGPFCDKRAVCEGCVEAWLDQPVNQTRTDEHEDKQISGLLEEE